MGANTLLEVSQRVHDYPHLVRRWRAVARASGSRLVEFARQNEFPVYYLAVPGKPGKGTVYISAGIHGDEPAGAEALIQWAERHLSRPTRRHPSAGLFLLPCLNPWGLTQNIRADHKGRDLNRIFERRISPLQELRQLLAGRRFELALHLHEDYDARGIYLYEVHGDRARDGERLLASCATAKVPLDDRKRIDGWPFRRGVMSGRVSLEEIPAMPEALYLRLHHTEHVCTFETPSEFGLTARVTAHQAMIDACLRLVDSR